MKLEVVTENSKKTIPLYTRYEKFESIDNIRYIKTILYTEDDIILAENIEECIENE